MALRNNVIKQLALISAGIIGVYLIVCFVVYRLPASEEPVNFEGRIIYKLTESTGTHRQLFEELVMRNRIIRLDDGGVYYVSQRDHEILWPEDPNAMHDKGYTIKTTLKAPKLFFGGYSKVEIAELQVLSEAPVIKE